MWFLFLRKKLLWQNSTVNYVKIQVGGSLNILIPNPFELHVYNRQAQIFPIAMDIIKENFIAVANNLSHAEFRYLVN